MVKILPEGWFRKTGELLPEEWERGLPAGADLFWDSRQMIGNSMILKCCRMTATKKRIAKQRLTQINGSLRYDFQ